jgi:hypothetical protein
MEHNTTQVFSTGTPAASRSSANSQELRRVGYLVAMLVNGALLYVFHQLVAWGAPWITEDWALVLPTFDLSIGATIVANMIYYSHDPRWLRRVGQIALNMLGLRAMFAVLTVFPFDLGFSMAENGLRVSLIVVMVGIAIGTLAEVVGLMFARE